MRRRYRHRYGRAEADGFDAALASYLANLGEGYIGRTRAYGRRLSTMKGPKYVRIVATDEGGSRSAVAFVDRNTGNIYAPNGWKGPTLNFPRGNIYKITGGT